MIKLALSAVFGMALLAGNAYGKTCKIEIEGNDMMQFNKKELTVEAACKTVEIVLKHVGKVPKNSMGHNVVVSLEKDKAALVADAMKAGAAAEYLPKSPAIIAATKLIGGGETTSTKFSTSKLKKGESYVFFCSFPGHATVMTGKLIYS